MGKYILDIPEDLHDKLRIAKVEQKKDIKDIIIDLLRRVLK